MGSYRRGALIEDGKQRHCIISFLLKSSSPPLMNYARSVMAFSGFVLSVCLTCSAADEPRLSDLRKKKDDAAKAQREAVKSIIDRVAKASKTIKTPEDFKKFRDA